MYVDIDCNLMRYTLILYLLWDRSASKLIQFTVHKRIKDGSLLYMINPGFEELEQDDIEATMKFPLN